MANNQSDASSCGSYPAPGCSPQMEMAVADLRMAVMWAEIFASNARHQIETGGGWLCDFNERMRECQQTVDACKKRIEELLENAHLSGGTPSAPSDCSQGD